MTNASKNATRGVVKRIARLPLARKLRLLVRLVQEPRLSWRSRVPLVLLLAYIAMPLDLIPDFIPVLGQLDDLLIIAVASWWFLRSCPPELVLPHLKQLEEIPVSRRERYAAWLFTAIFGLGMVFALWLAWRRSHAH